MRHNLPAEQCKEANLEDVHVDVAPCNPSTGSGPNCLWLYIFKKQHVEVGSKPHWHPGLWWPHFEPADLSEPFSVVNVLYN